MFSFQNKIQSYLPLHRFGRNLRFLIPLDNLNYIEEWDDRCVIHFINKESVVVSDSFDDIMRAMTTPVDNNTTQLGHI